MANQWTGYVSTTSQAWDQLTGAPVAQQISGEQLAAVRSGRPAMATGQVVSVTIPSTASGFAHRGEYVYLPPVWFTGPAPPATLPVIMMIGAELSTPADWIRAGDAVATADAYARDHGGYGRSWCSPTPPAASATTPNASTAPTATPPTTSPATSDRG